MNSSRSAGPRSRAGRGLAGRGSRSVSVLYGTFSAVLVVAALVMALIVRPPPPPSIAALGPSPQDQIEKARQNQAAGSGPGEVATTPPADEQSKTSAEQAGRSATSTTSPTTSSSPMEVPGTRRCFGDPPRQTEDPHSPPCVFEVFQGVNGGRTAPGVTATEIHVAADKCFLEDTLRALEALVEHFNRRYEFYGRRIVVEYVNESPTENIYCGDWANYPTKSHALAEEVISREPFSSILHADNVLHAPFNRDLADAGIHSILGDRPVFPSNELVDGWTWLVSPPMDVNQRLGGDLVCHAFNNRTARHAGPRVEDKRRKFAVIAVTHADNDVYPDYSPLKGRLEACGADAEFYKVKYAGKGGNAQFMADLNARDVTTIIQVADADWASHSLRESATKVGYFPEWLIIDSKLEDTEFVWENSDSSAQAPYAFGFSSNVRVRPTEETPAFWALNEGGGPENIAQWMWVEPFYKQLLVLASGIQGAGPNLTPESFRQALWETVWPNPNPGEPPYWQQRVSLGPGDPVFYDDYAIWWWNEDAHSQTPGSASNQDGRGSFCYLDRGGRFLPGRFPNNADGRLFSGSEPCR